MSDHKLDCLRTKKGLQGGITIRQRSDLFASLWSLMLLPVPYIHACALSAHTRVRVRVSVCGTFYSDILGFIVI